MGFQEWRMYFIFLDLTDFILLLIFCCFYFMFYVAQKFFKINISFNSGIQEHQELELITSLKVWLLNGQLMAFE